jgi:hypothetical protein
MAVETIREQAARHKKLILEGVVLAIDPGSTSFGWAIYKKGQLVAKGRWSERGPIMLRLSMIFGKVSALSMDHGPDILAIERIRSGGGYSPHQLLWSIGVTLAAAPVPMIEIPPKSWKVSAKELGLEKNDVNDAVSIGHRTIALAMEAGA